MDGQDFSYADVIAYFQKEYIYVLALQWLKTSVQMVLMIQNIQSVRAPSPATNRIIWLSLAAECGTGGRLGW